jgi:hypothetical protein
MYLAELKMILKINLNFLTKALMQGQTHYLALLKQLLLVPEGVKYKFANLALFAQNRTLLQKNSKNNLFYAIF